MSNLQTVAEAADALSEYTQAVLAQQRAIDEQNRLKLIEIEQQHKTLELERQRLDLERKAENRRDARITELLDHVARAEQQHAEQVNSLLSKLVTTDDSYGETVQRIIQVLRLLNGSQMDVEKAVYALIIQNETEIVKAKITIADRHQTSAIQDELIIRMQNLSRLELQAAGHGALNVPVKLQNDIAAEQNKIIKLQERLGVA